MSNPFFVYLLICADGASYTGHTDDLERRLAEHQEGGFRAFTSPRRPVQLAWHLAASAVAGPSIRSLRSLLGALGLG